MSDPSDYSILIGLYNVTGTVSDFVNDTGLDLTFIDVFTEELAYVLNVYFTPALVVMGTIGNLLSIIVFFKSKLHAQSTSQYLSALAISDTIFLLQLIPPWLKTVRVSRVFARQGFCQCFVYLTYVSSSTSSWLVVSFTIERFVAVLYPLRRTRMCTVRRARFLIFAITTSCLAVNTPVLKFAVPKRSECNIDYELMDHAARFNVVDTVFSFTLPLTIITVMNIWIVIGVCQLSRARKQLIKEEEMKPRARIPGRQPCGTLSGRRTRSSFQRSQQRITRMLLIVSSVFVLLNLPAYSMRILAYANNMSSYEYSGKWAALQQICLLFFNSNFGINFFLYCMTGQNFRKALCQTFSWITRVRDALGRFFCGWTKERVPPPCPSVTNSISVNTDASAVSKLNIKGAVSDSYLKKWHFENASRLKQHSVYCELQVYPVRFFRYQSDQPERPVPRWPDGSARLHPPGPTNIPDPVRVVAPQTFRPIPYNLVPGQIAQLPHDQDGLESPPIPVAYAYGSPFSLDEFENFLPDSDFVGEDNSLFARPQPPRKFSLPARENFPCNQGNTPPEFVSPIPWLSPPGSGATSPTRELSPAPRNEPDIFIPPRSRSPAFPPVSSRSPHAPAFRINPDSPPVILS